AARHRRASEERAVTPAPKGPPLRRKRLALMSSCPARLLVGSFKPRKEPHITVPGGQKMASTATTTATMTVKITMNDRGNPPGKLADAELHFGDGPLAGLKLIGFSVWERRGGSGRNVTFPARQDAVNGERRSFALLRPIADVTAQEGVREAILAAYAEAETAAAVAE